MNYINVTLPKDCNCVINLYDLENHLQFGSFVQVDSNSDESVISDDCTFIRLYLIPKTKKSIKNEE